jgi:hypothetical protein
MDLMLWLGIAAAVAIAVRMAAPYHHRLIDGRDVSFAESQLTKSDKI